jgi:hypothetical protein
MVLLHGVTESERQLLLSSIDFVLDMTYVADDRLRHPRSEKEWQRLAVLRSKVMVAGLASLDDHMR